MTPRAGRRAAGLAGPTLAVVVAIVVAITTTRGAGAPATAPSPLAVTSDAPRVATLVELVAASDLVVEGTVASTSRGRVFGEPGGGAVESRLVQVRIDEVLSGAPPDGQQLLLEEEGWLEDGTPLVVDGLAPTRTGDHGIWFLTEVPGPDGAAFVVVSAQGRYLIAGDHLEGASGDDPLVTQVTALGPDRLVTSVAALRQ